MESRRLTRIARLTLLGFVLGCAALLLWADPRTRIGTDVLELIPKDERQPELVMIRSLAGEQRARVTLFALYGSGSPETRLASAQAFVAHLRASPAFTEVVLMQESAARDALGKYVYEQRFNLLLPGWLKAHQQAYASSKSSQSWPDWLAAQTARELQAYLSQPEALALQDLLPSDPLLLMPTLVDAMKGLSGTETSPDGLILIWSTLRESPLAEPGQTPVFAAVDGALAAAKAIDPSARLRWTSLARFAAASRERIESELSTLNLGSLLAVLLVTAIGLRQFWKSLHLAPVVLGSVLFAWAVTLVAFPRVHVLVFVVGSLLTGVAIDYGFYLYLQPPAFPNEPYLGKARRLLRALLGSALTAILGFSLLVFSELPLIRQLGVFVGAGLLGAVVVALLWFAQVKHPYMGTRSFIRARPKSTRSVRLGARILLGVGAVIALVGPWRLTWRDNIRELEIPAAGLEDEARQVRALFGDTEGRTMYVTRGDTVAQARDQLERFTQWHRQNYPDQALFSAGQVLPGRAEWTELARACGELMGYPEHASFEQRLRDALTADGFDVASFEPFFRSWSAWLEVPLPDYDVTARALADAMRGPMSSLYSISAEGVWFVSIAEHRPDRDPPAGLGTASSSQLENLNRLFGRYRSSALRLSLLGLGLVGLSVFLIYGFRHGVGIFAVPVGACFITFGLFGLTGQTLNLFHLLGAFLGVCLSHNYSIFSAESDVRGEEQPPSVRLSALTTAASFGVLTMSHIPVVAALGVTVSTIVLIALAIVELKPLAGLTPRRTF